MYLELTIYIYSRFVLADPLASLSRGQLGGETLAARAATSLLL